MADATEDLLFPSSSSHKLQPQLDDHAASFPTTRAPADSDSDSEAGDSDTAPDYTAFLSSLAQAPSTSSFVTQTTQPSTLPKRGTKDFEPHPTLLQTSSLQRSRDAMAQALSHTRVHAPKVHVRGVYDSTTGMTRVSKVRGQMFGRLGRDVSGGGVELWPEEALWGLERGALDVFWPADEERAAGGQYPYPTPEGTPEPLGEGVVQGNKEEIQGETRLGLPMSLQAAYAAYIGGDWGLTAEKYVVYAGLKRAGFVVSRAEGFHGVRTRRRIKKMVGGHSDDDALAERQTNGSGGLWAWLQSFLATSETYASEQLANRPLVKPGLYRSYDDIYRMLRIIPSYQPLPQPSRPTHPSTSSGNTQTTLPGRQNAPQRPRQMQADQTELDGSDYEEIHTPYTTTYDIHRPLPHFRKSAPGKPDFRICVISARETRLPTLAELDQVLAEQPSDPPPAVFQPGQPPASTPPQQQHNAQGSSGTAARGGRGGRGGGRGRGFGIGGVYNRLKHGQRNVLLAVADEGVVSYLRMCEAGFAAERLYERVGPPAGRGGKGGGRGRGGARGGRGRGG